jgi:DNA-binding HxlR family transcriptional regulator
MTPAVRILLFLNQKGEVRYTELSKIIDSRGVLSNNLKALENEGLVNRRVVSSKPIQSHYSLSDRGVVIADSFARIKENLPRIAKQ